MQINPFFLKGSIGWKKQAKDPDESLGKPAAGVAGILENGIEITSLVCLASFRIFECIGRL
jgi:hypothetical protein